MPNMNYVLSNNVVLVEGAHCGAIYDLNNNKIYSINHDSKVFLLKYVKDRIIANDDEKEYIDLLLKSNLIDIEREYEEFSFLPNNRNELKFAWLEVTQTCNLRCVHCYEGQKHVSTGNNLSFEEWKSIIKELNECGCRNIQFIGGEPSCYKGITELIDYSRTFEFNSIGFFTNATFLSDSLFKCLCRNRVNVNISVYGHNSELHDRLTQIKGSFKKTIENIEKLLKNNVDVTVAITVMRENELYFEKIVKFLKALGVKKYKFDLYREVAGCKHECHLVTREDLIREKYKTKASFKINKTRFDAAFQNNSCWYGKFVISESGDVLPCVFERNIKYGSLKNNSIISILESEKLNKYWHLDYSQIEECCECEFRYACKDCRPLGSLNGGINKKTIRCSYSPKTGEWK